MLQAVAVLSCKDTFPHPEILHQSPEIGLIFCAESSCVPVFFIQNIFVEGIGFRLHSLTQIKLV